MEATMTRLSMAELAQAMLTENTGGNLVDSGAAFGRSWQRNQGVDFEKTPTASVSWSVLNGKLQGYTGTISLYHWLKLNFEPDDKMQEVIDSLGETEAKATWFDIAEAAAAELSTEAEPKVTYTYNEPDNWNLSQDIQFWEIFTESEHEPSHLIVMVHNGCDARWGFTKPYALKITTDHWVSSAQVDGISAGGHTWISDGGYGAAYECQDEGVEDFFSLPVVDLVNDDEYQELIARAERQYEALSDTDLGVDQVEAARDLLKLTLLSTRMEIVRERSDDLDGPHLLLDNKDKVTVLIDGDEYEITVGNAYL